jgi:molecular chaperone GrpE
MKSSGETEMSQEEQEKKVEQEEREGAVSELDVQKAEYEALNQRFLRLAADFDNYRKRTRNEMGEIGRQAVERLVLSQLDVLDNFERALENDSTSESHEAFRDGIVMILSQFRAILEKEGLRPIEAKVNPFDTSLHEAVSVIPSGELEDETVMEETQKGYCLGERLLRPAKVVVSRKPGEVGDTGEPVESGNDESVE